jgi:hypothetical protein
MILATAAALLALLPLCAGEMTMQLDTSANVRLFDTHFARYGFSTAKTITRDAKGVVRIRLPSATKDIGQTGMYSYVVLAGDFEVSVNYEWVSVDPPQGGYGVSCGIAVDAGGDKENVSLSRANIPDKGDGYAITVGTPEGTEVKYDTTHIPTKATRGRLVVRREGGELICLALDGAKGEPRELHRMPFPKTTLRQVRIYADAGGSLTAVDVRLSQVRIRAEEITGGFPRGDQPMSLPWWPFLTGGCLVAAVLLVVIRYRQQRAAA